MRRILTAVVLVPLLWVVIKWAPPWAFAGLFAAGIAGGVLEAYGLVARRGHRPFRALGLLAGASIAWAFSGLWPFGGPEPLLGPLAPVVAVGLLAPVAALWTRPDPPAMLDAAISTLFPVVAVALPLGYLIGLRMLPGETGADLLLLLLVCVTFGDTAAYYVGSVLGRHRLAPRLSPKKSWEGAIGGIAGSLLGALLAHAWFFQRLPLGHAVALGVLLGSTGIVGDLAESMVKRACDAKDSSRLLPGHGGILDRTDSLIVSAPVLYYYFRLFLSR